MLRPFRIPMVGRDPGEDPRAATPLELFFDLVFVVAIAEAAAAFHHAVAADHVGEGLLQYGMVFFAIWWAWMGFTWFATSFDTDDVLYRIATFIQMTGALILAAGVPAASEHNDFTLATIGYVVMRVPLIAQWARVARDNPDHRGLAVRMGGGLAVVQTLWVLALFFVPDHLFLAGFVTLLVVELLLPYWAWLHDSPDWHAEHIQERYGLLTIIVLGESILAISMAVQAVMGGDGLTASVLQPVLGGLLVVFALWWIYFEQSTHHTLSSFRRAFIWGYGHYLIYASAAAVGAGIAVSVDFATDHASIGSFGAGMAVAAPVAVFLVTLSVLYRREETSGGLLTLPLTAGLVLLTPFTPYPVVLTGLILSGLVAVSIYLHHVGYQRALSRS